MSDGTGQNGSMVPLAVEDLPNLPTIQDRVAWLLGRLTEQTPKPVRPMIRSLLLPKLATLDDASLTETLVVFQDVILPWVLTGVPSDGGASADEDERFAV